MSLNHNHASHKMNCRFEYRCYDLILVLRNHESDTWATHIDITTNRSALQSTCDGLMKSMSWSRKATLHLSCKIKQKIRTSQVHSTSNKTKIKINKSTRIAANECKWTPRCFCAYENMHDHLRKWHPTSLQNIIHIIRCSTTCHSNEANHTISTITVGTSTSAFLTVATHTQSKHKGTAQTNMCKLKHKNVTATRLRIHHTTLATNHIYKCTETFQNTFKCCCMQQAHTASRKHVSTQS